MTGDVIIRTALASDAGALAGLHGRCFDEAWNDAAIGALLAGPGAVACIAEMPNGIAGFAILRVIADEGEVLSLAVAPERRRAGIGHALLAQALAAAARHGARRVVLEVADTNGAAQALYRRQGFVTVGRRRRYYAAGDADILAVSLTAPE